MLHVYIAASSIQAGATAISTWVVSNNYMDFNLEQSGMSRSNIWIKVIALISEVLLKCPVKFVDTSAYITLQRIISRPIKLIEFPYPERQRRKRNLLIGFKLLKVIGR